MNDQLCYYISIEPDFFKSWKGEFGVKIPGAPCPSQCNGWKEWDCVSSVNLVFPLAVTKKYKITEWISWNHEPDAEVYQPASETV